MMEKTSKFVKSLFGFKPSDPKSHNHETNDHQHQTVSRPSDTPLDHSINHHTVVAEQALLPHGATKVEDVRKKSRKRWVIDPNRKRDGYGLLGVWAAVRIQAYYRSYLARKALRALKALVKLQALVRGHILRKQLADDLRRLQTLVRAQAQAREKRLQFVDSPESTTKVVTSQGSTIHPPGLSPSEYYEVNSHTAPLEYSSDHPNYMSYTKSSQGKVRSLSARIQRPNIEVPSATKRCLVYGYASGTGTKRGSNLRDGFVSKAYPGSGRLDRLGMPV